MHTHSVTRLHEFYIPMPGIHPADPCGGRVLPTHRRPFCASPFSTASSTPPPVSLLSPPRFESLIESSSTSPSVAGPFPLLSHRCFYDTPMMRRLRVDSYFCCCVVVCRMGTMYSLILPSMYAQLGYFQFFFTINEVCINISVLPLARYMPSFGGYV